TGGRAGRGLLPPGPRVPALDLRRAGGARRDAAGPPRCRDGDGDPCPACFANAATARAAPSHRTGRATRPTQRRVLSGVTLQLLTLGGRLAGAQTTVRVSVASDGTEGNDVSMGSALSADGRFVAFDSAAADLVAGDTNRVSDVFVHDRQTGTTERVSVASGGAKDKNGSSRGVFAFPAPHP